MESDDVEEPLDKDDEVDRDLSLLPRRNPPRNRRPPKRLINMRPGYKRRDWQKPRPWPDLPDNISDEGTISPYSCDTPPATPG